MAKEIVLTSETAHLHIVLENKDCSLTCSPDGSTLYVESPSGNFIPSSDLHLKNGAGEEIWSASLTTYGISNQERIRVDSIFPLVFNKDEIVQVFPSLILTFDRNCTCRNNVRPIFKLLVEVKLSSTTAAIPSPRTAPIYSATLTVDETSIPISKELMISSSPFFERLFNANFLEKEKGIYEIKDVSVEDFIWFITSYHSRKWEFSSMDRALLALSYADRYELLYLHCRVFPYLKFKQLEDEQIKDTLIVSAKFKRIDNLILWVLSQYSNQQTALEILHECASELPTIAVQAAFKAMMTISENEKKKGALSLIGYFNRGSSIAVHLRCHDSNSGIIRDDTFCIYVNSNNSEIRCSDVWEKIPKEYGKADINGTMMKRNEVDKIRAGGNSMAVEAYT